MPARIVCFSGIEYLSQPQYFQIVPLFNDKELIYLNTKDPVLHWRKIKAEYQTDEILQYFHRYVEMKELQDFPGHGLKVKFSRLKDYRRFVRELRAKLDELQPDAIISGSDMSLSDRTAVQWCNRHGVPFIILMPALIETIADYYPLPHRLKYLSFNRILSFPLYRKGNFFGHEDPNTHVLVWGDYFKRMYRKDHVYTVGNPRLDEVLSHPEIRPRESATPTILICTESIEYFEHRLGKALMEATHELWRTIMTGHPEWQFIVKPHPSDRSAVIMDTFGHLPNVTVDSDTSLYELFRISDVQLSVNSASSLEAVAAGLPIILTNLDKETNRPLDFFEGDIALQAETAEVLYRQILKALSPDYLKSYYDTRESFLIDMLHSPDGQSARRVAKEVEEIIVASASSSAEEIPSGSI